MQQAGAWCDWSMPAVLPPGRGWDLVFQLLQDPGQAPRESWWLNHLSWHLGRCSCPAGACGSQAFFPGFWRADSSLILELLVGPCVVLLELVVLEEGEPSMPNSVLAGAEEDCVCLWGIVLCCVPCGTAGMLWSTWGLEWDGIFVQWHPFFVFQSSFRWVAVGLFKGESVNGSEISRFIVHHTAWIYKPWHDLEMGCELLAVTKEYMEKMEIETNVSHTDTFFYRFLLPKLPFYMRFVLLMYVRGHCTLNQNSWHVLWPYMDSVPMLLSWGQRSFPMKTISDFSLGKELST